MQKTANQTVEPAAVDPPFPCHPLSYEGDQWTCPITGLTIYKGLSDNLIQRAQIMDVCRRESVARGDMLRACAGSFLFWVNAFGWTYRQHEVLPSGERRLVPQAQMPFITWPVQDVAATDLIEAIRTGQDLLFDKSRDMGASWLNLAVIAWMELFEQDFTA